MKAIIFDRDGTLIEFVDFLYKEKDVVINKDFLSTLKFLINIQSVKFFIHTNQSGVFRGMFNIDDVNNCNSKIFELLKNKYDLEFCVEKIYIAPSFDSIYRKPTKQVVLELEKGFNFRRQDILYIGDTLADYKTAINSGTQFIIYRGYASKPIDEELKVENKYIANDDLELLSMVKRFIHEGND
tara:strand:+ start:3933 stop:4484 length:552 start_codon:yes stop_codon:yes gene_type:complete